MQRKLEALFRITEDGEESEEAAEICAFREGFLTFLQNTPDGGKWLEKAERKSTRNATSAAHNRLVRPNRQSVPR